MRLRQIASLLVVSSLVACARGSTSAPDPADVEAIVRALDDEERRAALGRDVAALERLWSPSFTVNAPNNRVAAGRDAVMSMFVGSGVINFSRFDRNIETVLVDGDYVFIMGSEIVVPVADAPSAGLRAGQVVERRFTNVWKNEAGTWRLFARHANVIPPR